MNPTKLAEFIELSDDPYSIPNLSFLIQHECLHVIREHFLRSSRSVAKSSVTSSDQEAFDRGFDQEHHRWNVACDLEVNSGLDQSTICIPTKYAPMYPSDFGLPGNLLAEAYYELLPNDKIHLIEFSDEGSGVFGQPRDWESNIANRIDESNALSEFDIALVKQTVAIDILDHQAKHGNIPGNVLRLADSILGRSQIDWRTKLRRLMRRPLIQASTGRVAYTYRKPSRRAASSAILLPAMVGGQECRVCVVVDTSGSMSSHAIALAIREISAIANALNCGEIEVIPCDADAYEPINLKQPGSTHRITSLLDKKMIGGGGTDLRIGVAAAMGDLPKWNAKHCTARRSPDIVIVLTDGESPFPATRYKTPVVFAVIEGGVTILPHPWTNADLVKIKC